MSPNKDTIYKHPDELLQNLIRFDTTNPPGNEAACISYIKTLLDNAGFKTKLLAKDPNRPNLITRLNGSGEAPHFLLYGHIDVVSTEGQTWRYHPFEGKKADGYIWGRGALDMKGGIAMMLASILRMKAERIVPKGDIVFTVLCDEEAGIDLGAKYIVENYSEQFSGIKYAVGEFGGFPMYFGGKKFYAIQVAEKQACWLKATLKGPGGHGSLPHRDGVMAKLADILLKLNTNRLPVHIPTTTRKMFETVIASTSGAAKAIVSQLLIPEQTDAVLGKLGLHGLMFEAMFHNTVNVTKIHGGDKINVIPSEITFEMDGRILPGFTPKDLVSEIFQVVGKDMEIEVIRYDEGPTKPDFKMFDILSGIIQKADPDGICMPLLLPASTDARHFSKIGIQTYGFLPMNLPPDFNFAQSIHAGDERVPVDSLFFGSEAIFQLLKQYKS